MCIQSELLLITDPHFAMSAKMSFGALSNWHHPHFISTLMPKLMNVQ